MVEARERWSTLENQNAVWTYGSPQNQQLKNLFPQMAV